MAPRPPRGTVRSLPPILRMTNQSSILGCSKGARGLSVLMRVTGIFTGTTNSRCHSLRQRSNRYAIRAGRNLPDKEFRYLRTVIVTAAVYRGFSSELLRNCFPMTPPFNLPAPGRRQPLYIAFLALQRPVFLVNSRLTLFTAASSSFRGELLHSTEAPLIPKLRGEFAEFLNECSHQRLRILSSSTCVGLRYGRLEVWLEVFLGSVESVSWFARRRIPQLSLELTDWRICQPIPPTIAAAHPVVRIPILLRPPIAHNVFPAVQEY